TACTLCSESAATGTALFAALFTVKSPLGTKSSVKCQIADWVADIASASVRWFTPAFSDSSASSSVGYEFRKIQATFLRTCGSVLKLLSPVQSSHPVTADSWSGSAAGTQYSMQ